MENYNRTTREYRLARLNALRRDKHKCKFPNCTKRAAQVHHIVRFADSPYLMWDVNNLISLCKEHHKMIYNKEIYYIKLFSDINANSNRYKRKT